MPNCSSEIANQLGAYPHFDRLPVIDKLIRKQEIVNVLTSLKSLHLPRTKCEGCCANKHRLEQIESNIDTLTKTLQHTLELLESRTCPSVSSLDTLSDWTETESETAEN
jgi:hypothetical protein